MRQKILHIVTGITKCGKNLLQSVKDTTKCVEFYKVRGNSEPSWKVRLDNLFNRQIES